MSNEELVEKLRNGGSKDLILQLMSQTEGFTVTIAKPFVRSGAIDREELAAIAFLAIWRVIYKSDSDLPFLTQLKFSLLTELTACANQSAPVLLPRNLRAQMNRYLKFRNAFYSQHGRDPSDQEILVGLGIDKYMLENLKLN